MRALSPLSRMRRARPSARRAATQSASLRRTAARSSEPPLKAKIRVKPIAPASFGIGRPPGRAFCRFAFLEHAVDDGNRLLEIADRVLELDPLLAQGFKAFAEFRRRYPELRELTVPQIIEIEHFLDLFKRKADLLAAQDKLQAGAVAIAEQAGPTTPVRMEQPLLFV